MGWFVALGGVSGFFQYRLMRAAMGRKRLLPLIAKFLLWAATLGLPLIDGAWAMVAAALAAAAVYTACALLFMRRAREEG